MAAAGPSLLAVPPSAACRVKQAAPAVSAAARPAVNLDLRRLARGSPARALASREDRPPPAARRAEAAPERRRPAPACRLRQIAKPARGAAIQRRQSCKRARPRAPGRTRLARSFVRTAPASAPACPALAAAVVCNQSAVTISAPSSPTARPAPRNAKAAPVPEFAGMRRPSARPPTQHRLAPTVLGGPPWLAHSPAWMARAGACASQATSSARVGQKPKPAAARVLGPIV